MLAMSIGEVDFSMERLMSMVTCIVGTVMTKSVMPAILMLTGIVVVYMIIGAFIHLKKLPSIIVTIGMSFIWTGIAVTLQPTPGGDIVNLLNILGMGAGLRYIFTGMVIVGIIFLSGEKMRRK